MPIAFTCGGLNKRTQFQYEGNLDDGVIIYFPSGNIKIDHDFFMAIINHFKGKEILGGFSMTNPPPDGFGQWVKSNSKRLNRKGLTPRHGSFIAAVLRDMGFLQCRLAGSAVILKFNDQQA